MKPVRVGSPILALTGRQFSKVGVNLSRTKSRSSSLVDVTHSPGPGSSLMAQQAQQITVWVFEDWAAHWTAMSRMALFEKSSMTARTQGEESDRQRPGMGEDSSTWTNSSHHCHGGRRSEGLQAAQNAVVRGCCVVATYRVGRSGHTERIIANNPERLLSRRGVSKSRNILSPFPRTVNVQVGC